MLFLTLLVGGLAAEAPKVAGKWNVTLDTPHGAMQGSFDLKQDGEKLSGSLTVQPMGTLTLNGKLEGKDVSMSIDLPDGNGKFGLTGSLDGDKMSGKTEMGGEWKAARQ